MTGAFRAAGGNSDLPRTPNAVFWLGALCAAMLEHRERSATQSREPHWVPTVGFVILDGSVFPPAALGRPEYPFDLTPQ